MLSNAHAPRGYLIDLDGTLMSGRNLLAGAGELLARLEGRFVIVSNDSEHTPQQLVGRFADLGIRLDSGQVILAGTCALETIAKRHPRSRVMVLGSTPLRAYARRLDLDVEDPQSDVVLVARDRRFSYAKLAAAAEAVTRGAMLYVACPDTSHPGANGQPVPKAGALAADFIGANAADVVHMSVTEVAERAGSSEGSVIGLCQQLGARGFRQIKIALARDLVQPVQFIHEDLEPGDNIATVVENIFRSDMQALLDTQKALDLGALARAVAAIRKACRVELFGIGSAATIAEDANYRLLRIGVNSRATSTSASRRSPHRSAHLTWR